MQKGSSKQIDNITGEVLKDIDYEFVFDNDNQVKALELLGKNLILWTDKQEIEHSGSITFVDDVPLDDDD